jgi:hypothetical protein
MRPILMTVVAATAVVCGRAAMVAAPGQTQRPGEMTKALVWVENREAKEAIPITIQDASRDLAPLRVRVINAQSAPGVDEPVPVRARRVQQPWEYRTVVFPGTFPVAATPLNDLGVQGWETTGISFVAADGATTVLLKRPR